jgi:L-ribulose-5-phosphate 4-epimerase
MSELTVSTVSDARVMVHTACLAMVADGLVVGSAGNISVRLDQHTIVVSPAGVQYHALSPQDYPTVDLRDGTWSGPRRPTSELALHVGVMRAMPDTNAVVHTHSRHAAAFAVARLDIPFICNESLATHAERVPVTQYAPPGTVDLGEQALATLRELPGCRAVLLANHGVVALADNLDDAYLVARSVEWTAEICILARQLGGEHVLSPEVQDAVGRNYGVHISHGESRSDPSAP